MKFEFFPVFLALVSFLLALSFQYYGFYYVTDVLWQRHARLCESGGAIWTEAIWTPWPCP